MRDSNEPITIAIGTSGVSVHKCGEWVERVHGKRRRYIKISFAVDVKAKEVLSMH